MKVQDTELSYMELLEGLSKDIKTDSGIAECDRENIIKHLFDIYAILELYSY